MGGVIDPNESIQIPGLGRFLGIAWVIGDKVEAGISIVIPICGGAECLFGRPAVVRILQVSESTKFMTRFLLEGWRASTHCLAASLSEHRTWP